MTKPIIVDSHCHLDFPDFEGEIPDLIMRAQEAGVKLLNTCLHWFDCFVLNATACSIRDL